MSDAPSADVVVPPTEPKTETPSATKRRGRPKKPAARQLKGADLVPDIGEAIKNKTAEKPTWYWLGALPACPVSFVTVGGVSFGKVSATLVPDPENKRQKIKQMMLGKCEPLTLDQIEAIKTKLRRTVVRWTDKAGPPPAVEHGVGNTIQDVFEVPRKGILITVRSKEEMEAARKDGRPLPPYVAQPNDEPIARYLFAELCDDQSHPRPGAFYPQSLETTGLPLPE